MSDSTARAVVLGIAALYEIAEEAGRGPVKPSLALRAILALVFEASHQCRKRDRAPFDAFWKAVADPGADHLHELDRNYARKHAARMQVAAIARTFSLDTASEGYTQVIDGLLRNQRMAVDPEFRSRILIAAAVGEVKHIPRGMTSAEWEYAKSQGWYERPR